MYTYIYIYIGIEKSGKHLNVNWVIVWNREEAESTVLLPYGMTDMEKAEKGSESAFALFGFLGLGMGLLFFFIYLCSFMQMRLKGYFSNLKKKKRKEKWGGKKFTIRTQKTQEKT